MLVVCLNPASSSSLSSVLSPSVALCKMMASAHFKSSTTAFGTSKSLFKNFMPFFEKGLIFLFGGFPINKCFYTWQCFYVCKFPAKSGKYGIPSALNAGVFF